MKKATLSMVRELAQCSKTEIMKANKLANKCKVSGRIIGTLAGTSAALNGWTCSIYSKHDDDKKWLYAALTATSTALSILAFKNVGSMNKVQKMIKIASKYSTVA